MSGTVLEDLPFCLARATLSFRRFNDQTLRAVGLDSLAPGMSSVLHALEEHDDCTINRLVETTHLPNGTLTGLLDELEEEGHIERLRNPDDGRSWLVRLSPSGRRLCTKLQKRHRLVMDVFEESLSEAEMAELTRLLGKATTCMRAHVADDDGQKSAVRTKPAVRPSR
jgi:DNA-binding MarR family transcriptional regulator